MNKYQIIHKLRKYIESGLGPQEALGKMYKDHGKEIGDRAQELFSTLYAFTSLPNKFASIVDFPHETLPQDLFDYGNEIPFLKEYIKEDILRRIFKFFEDEGIVGANDFLIALLMGGSTATQFYTKDTDVDVKVIIDMYSFKKYNKTTMDSDELLDELINKIRISDVMEGILPDTSRPVDFYFYAEEEMDLSQLNKYDSLYDILENTWIKEPIFFNPDSFDPDILLDRTTIQVEGWANKLDLQLGKLKRQIKDFDILREYLYSLSKENRIKLQEKLSIKLKEIGNEVDGLAKDFDLIVDERHKVFHEDFDPDPEKYLFSINWTPENVQFKLLQRWGYLKILRELKVLLEDEKLEEQEIAKIKDILKQGQTNSITLNVILIEVPLDEVNDVIKEVSSILTNFPASKIADVLYGPYANKIVIESENSEQLLSILNAELKNEFKVNISEEKVL